MIAPLLWTEARVVSLRAESAAARTIEFEVPGWPGHLAGQHVDVRLTAADGYTAQRSYSIASAAGPGPRLSLTVDRIEMGEVSTFLHDELRIGDSIELRGPIGGYFTWTPGRPEPLLLIAGGSGVVPLMSMLRTRLDAPYRGDARLLYSSRSEARILYRGELEEMAGVDRHMSVTHTLTREAPPDWTGERGRVGGEMLARGGFPAASQPEIFICGPTPFVEAATTHLLALGHPGSAIRTERFGPTGVVK